MSGFIYGTMVHTKDGLRSIEDIKAGDYVLSNANDELGTIAYQPVAETFHYTDQEIYFVAWHVLNETLKWYESERDFVVVTASQEIWFKEFIDEKTGATEKINRWMTIGAFYNINFEEHWLHNRAGKLAQILLTDGRIAELNSVQPILKSSDPNMGVGFEDDVYWNDNGSGPAILFQEDGPSVSYQDNGLYVKASLHLEDTIDYEGYPARSIVHRSGGFRPLRRQVFNLKIEGHHSYIVGKTGLVTR